MKKIVVASAILGLCALSFASAAQSTDYTYTTAVGVTFGWWNSASLSVKHFIKENAALEARLALWRYGGEGCGLYEWYGDFPNAAGLRWYAGAGGHFGVYNTEWTKNYPDRSGGAYLGPDGVLGIDYKFNNAPINVSFDIQPRVDFPDGYFNVWGGLGVRFAF